jgi:LMBR1 domain-containing protein 1
MLDKVSFSGKQFAYDFEMHPGVSFFKYLARKPVGSYRQLTSTVNRLRLNIPDTIVFNDEDSPIWLYTSDKGYIYRTENFFDQHIMSRLGNSTTPEEVVAVFKRLKYNNKAKRQLGFTTTVLNTYDLSARLGEVARGNPCVLQKFVKCNGPVPFVCRAVYRKDAKASAYILTNKAHFKDQLVDPSKRFLTTVEVKDSCTVVQISSGKYLEQTLPLLKDIVKFLEHNLKVQFEEFAGDFIKDEAGTWWFVSCKAFRITGTPSIRAFIADNGQEEEAVPDVHKFVANYRRLLRCRLCQVPHPEAGLSHQLTMKMIVDTDKHLRQRGIAIEWLDRAEYRKSDIATVYQSFRVCHSCYSLFEQTEELKDLMSLFKEAFGIPDLTNTATNYAEMPDDWMLELPPSEQAVLIINDQPGGEEESDAPSKPLTLFRMLVVVKSYVEVPKSLQASDRLLLEYSAFNCKQTVPLRSKPFIKQQLDFVPIYKMRLFHFYAGTRDNFKEFLKKNSRLTFKLYCNSEPIAEAHCDLSDFANPIVNKKEYYELFTGRDINVGYLDAEIGLLEGQLEDVSRVKLKAFKGVFVPPVDFIFCEPLPSEWLDIIPELTSIKRAIFTRYGIHLTKDKPSILSNKPLNYRPVSSGTRQSPRDSSRGVKSVRTNLTFALNRSREAVKAVDLSLSLPKHRKSRSVSHVGKLWTLTIQVHCAEGLDERSSWMVSCEVLDASFEGNENLRKGHRICFNLIKPIHLKCRPKALKKLLETSICTFTVHNEEVSTFADFNLGVLNQCDHVTEDLALNFPRSAAKLSISAKLSRAKHRGLKQSVR